MRINKIRDIVSDCLAENVNARNSDWVLYKDVCRKMGIKIADITVEQMCDNSRIFPSWESVTRARRKLQEMEMYLATEVVQKNRKVQERNYREEYA